jgi:two-component system response regulator CpxR
VRPRKRVLLIDANEDRSGILRFTLEEVWKYRILLAKTAEEAIYTLASEWVEIVLLDMTIPASLPCLEKLKAIAPHIPMVLIGTMRDMEMAGTRLADAFFTRSISAMELLERLKVMSARKRGPRPCTAPVPKKEEVA